jgi:tRNA(fMet)-specific endonuclease VapC
LDTNTLIYFYEGEGDVAQQLLTKSPLEIGIPAIVLLELEVGIAKSSSPKKRRQQLRSWYQLLKCCSSDTKKQKLQPKCVFSWSALAFRLVPTTP